MPQALAYLARSPMLFVVMLLAGIGGTFQYGYNVAVLNSASLFIKDLVNKTCQEHYGLFLEPQSLTLLWSFIISIFCLGGMIGSFVSGRLVVSYGRKKTLLLNSFVAIAGAIFMLFSKTATSFEMIIVGRLLHGVNAGIGFTSHALYVMECSPKRLRGLVGASVCFFIALGRFFAQLLGFREFLGTEEHWPWLVGFSGLMGTLQLVTLTFMPESPQYLLLDMGDQKGCEKAMKQLWGKHSYAQELEELLLQKASIQKIRSRSLVELFRDRAVRWQLITIIFMFLSLQMSGINVVYLYSFDVFRTVGIQPSQMRYATLGTSICELMTSITCVMVIESTGRRPLLIGGYLAMGTALGLLTVSLYLQDYVSWMPYCSMALVFMYILIFGCGPGGVTASIPGEILTQEYKASAFTIGCSLSWFGLFIIGMTFPFLVESLGEYCFLIFTVFCIITVYFVWFHIPETKNRTILEIMDDFQGMHKPAGTKQGAQLALNEFWTVKTTKL